jgi:hypothetical protein
LMEASRGVRGDDSSGVVAIQRCGAKTCMTVVIIEQRFRQSAVVGQRHATHPDATRRRGDIQPQGQQGMVCKPGNFPQCFDLVRVKP